MTEKGTNIRILGIAPYNGMQTAMERVAEEYPAIHLEAYTGDMEEGVSIVMEHQEELFDVIISRGGTAELIKRISDIPVISVQLSVYDILRTIKMAENYSKLYAIIGFGSVTEPAHTLCNLLQIDADIITISSADEAESTLERLKINGYKMVIGDMITHTLARQKGFDAFLITSGLESFHDAFNQAITISKQFHRLQWENIFLKKFVQEKSGNVIVLSEKGELHYFTKEPPAQKQLEVLRPHIPEVPATAPLKFYQNDNGSLYRVTARMLRIGQAKYYTFHYQVTQIPLRLGKNGIHAFNEIEITQLFMNSFYSISGAIGDLEKSLNSIAKTRQPVMILGETGTGKEQIARILYLRSPRVKNPFIVIDCNLMTDKNWNFLFSHYSSPLNDDSNTIYFQNLEALPEIYCQELLNTASGTDITKRLRLIFSCTCGENQVLPETAKTISSRLGCITLRLPALRSRIDELPSLASLYLSNLNMEMGKQIIGFDPQARELLLNYEWPNNYTQFKQVLQELATLTESAYIQRSTVIHTLSNQRNLYRKSGLHTADTDFKLQTLEEITRWAIQQTIDALDGNQSAAAKQLGISRTTLWRHLAMTAPDK